MKQAYPITITKDSSFYVVYIPDFDLNTQGESVAEAMEMARDVIGMTGCYLEDEKRALPDPSPIDAIRVSIGTIITLIDVDFKEYRRRHDNRTVRKNLTIPSWLNEEAEAAGLVFSEVLKTALKHELGISDN